MANNWATSTYRINAQESEQKLRLDPCYLPQSVSFKGQESGKNFTAFLTERGILIQEHQSQTALPDCAAESIAQINTAKNSHISKQGKAKFLKIFSPRQFLGIAAGKVAVKGSSEKAFSLMLLHEKADYCVPLLISSQKDDVLLDWRLWADSYNLPMLITEGEHGFRPLRGRAMLKLFINDHKINKPQRDFSLRCRGYSLNTRLIVSNQVMLG